MANAKSRTKQSPRIEKLREQAERGSAARVLGLPRGACWRDIAATELAETDALQFAEDSAWFHELDEIDLDREMCDGFGYYSSPMSGSSFPDNDVDDVRFEHIMYVPDYDPYDYWEI
jgi:hypothetical protein